MITHQEWIGKSYWVIHSRSKSKSRGNVRVKSEKLIGHGWGNDTQKVTNITILTLYVD